MLTTEEGKTEYSTARNSKGWMWQREESDGQQSIDRMVEHAVGVLMMSYIFVAEVCVFSDFEQLFPEAVVLHEIMHNDSHWAIQGR